MLPREMRPKDNRFLLTDNTDFIQQEIARARKEEHAWPQAQYLWELHPVMEWLSDKVLAGMGRHEAPVIQLETGLAPGETVYLLSGLIPNRKGHPVIQHWFGVSLQRQTNDLGAEDFATKGIRDLDELLNATGFGRKEIPNSVKPMDTQSLQKNLKRVVNQANKVMTTKRQDFEKEMAPRLEEHLSKLRDLENRHKHRINKVFGTTSAEKRRQKLRDVETTFLEYTTWVAETLETEDAPYIKVVAVFTRQ